MEKKEIFNSCGQRDGVAAARHALWVSRFDGYPRRIYGCGAVE